MDAETSINSTPCPQCNQAMLPNYVYCFNCGQKRIKAKESLIDFFKSFLGDYFAYDSKLALSLRPLLFKPGFLTLEYEKGRRVNYIPPLRMYVFISIIFFLVLNWNQSTLSNGEDIIWKEFFESYLPKVFFFLLPIFAALVMLVFRSSRKGYVLSLVFSFHYHAFIFLILTLYLLVSRILAANGLYGVNTVILIALGTWFLIYLPVALKRVYKKSGGATWGRFFLLLLLYSAIVLITLLGIMMVLITLDGSK